MEDGGGNLADVLTAVASLAWPVIAILVVWRFYPHLKQVIESRAFTIKIGGMEISAQDATSSLHKQIRDLQDKVEELRVGQQVSRLGPDVWPDEVEEAGDGAGAEPDDGPRARPAPAPKRPSKHVWFFNRIVWVDDQPENNVFEMARLRERGFEVVEVHSTREALEILRSLKWEVDVVITDMGRKVGRGFRQDAGIDLVKSIKEESPNTRTVVYSGHRTIREYRDRILQAGADAATSSTIELYELLGMRPSE